MEVGGYVGMWVWGLRKTHILLKISESVGFMERHLLVALKMPPAVRQDGAPNSVEPRFSYNFHPEGMAFHFSSSLSDLGYSLVVARV